MSEEYDISVTILILVDGFLQSQHRPMSEEYDISVTILILVDGFLQLINPFLKIKG